MITFTIVCLTLVSSSYGLFGGRCEVDPVENRWLDTEKVCHETMGYNHDAIEQAIADDPEMQMYLNDASRIYEPVLPNTETETETEYRETCNIDTSYTNGPQMVECGEICPRQHVNLTTVWYEYKQGKRTMCNVIRPWQQIVYYMQCGTKYPVNVDVTNNSFQCVPEDIIRRRIAIYCPDIVPQCRKMDIDLPQHCAASKFKCLPKKTPLFKTIDNIFANLGFF